PLHYALPIFLIRPLKLVSNANGLLELERLESLNRRGKVRARLVLTLTNILGLTRVKNNSLALPELHRDRTRELRNNGRLLDLLQPRSEILVRDRQITGIKNGHYRILSFQAFLPRSLRMCLLVS